MTDLCLKHIISDKEHPIIIGNYIIKNSTKVVKL